MTQLIKFEEQQKQIQTLKSMALIAVNSGKYNSDYNEATILNIFLTANSLGIDPMIALNGGFNIIKGKINMGAHFMTALARRKGHSIKVIEMSDKKCVIIAQRKDNGDSLKYEYTWEEAVKAGLTGKDNWKNIPKQMLYCGCVRNVFRILFSDLGIAYDQDEMNVESEIIEDPVNMEVIAPHLEKRPPMTCGEPLEILSEMLKSDGISAHALQQYISEVAAKKKENPDLIVQSALLPELLPRFKTAYLKFLDRISAAEQLPLPQEQLLA